MGVDVPLPRISPTKHLTEISNIPMITDTDNEATAISSTAIHSAFACQSGVEAGAAKKKMYDQTVPERLSVPFLDDLTAV